MRNIARIDCPNPKCEYQITEPIKINDFSTRPKRTYHGCPCCLIEIRNKYYSTKHSQLEKKDSKVCTFFFGYLKARSKDTSIPQECFVCPKLIECIKDM